jgi:hypothetical protein
MLTSLSMSELELRSVVLDLRSGVNNPTTNDLLNDEQPSNNIIIDYSTSEYARSFQHDTELKCTQG